MEEIKKIREEMAKILGLDASNEDVLNNIEKENEHTISYQLDDWEVDRFQELKARLKELEIEEKVKKDAEERKIREEMAKILGLDPTDEDVLKNIENENEHTISYQLDDWEIDRFQELRDRLNAISGKSKTQPEQTTQKGKSTTPVGQTPPQPATTGKGGTTQSTTGQTMPPMGATKAGPTAGATGKTTPQPDPAQTEGSTSNTDGATVGKDKPDSDNSDKAMKTTSQNGFLIAVGNIVKAILDFIESLRGKVPQGGLRDKLLGKIENGLKKVAGRPVAVNVTKAKEQAKTASSETQKIIKETREKKNAKAEQKTQAAPETPGENAKGPSKATLDIISKNKSKKDGRTEAYTRDMKWAQSLINDNSADNKVFQDAVNTVFESMRNVLMNYPADKQNSIFQAKVRRNNVPHIGKTAYEDWLLYLTVNKLRSMAGNNNISISDETTKELRPLEDVYKELVEKMTAKSAKAPSPIKTSEDKLMSQDALNLKWVIEQRDGPKGDRLFDKFEDKAIEDCKPLLDAVPKKGEENYDQKREIWINKLMKLKQEMGIPDIPGANLWSEVEGTFILIEILEEAEKQGIKLKDEKQKPRHIKDIYKELEEKAKTTSDSGKSTIYSENEQKADMRWALENIINAEHRTPLMDEIYAENDTTISSTMDEKMLAKIIEESNIQDIGEAPRETLLSYCIADTISEKARKQGIPTIDSKGKFRPIEEVYRDLETKMELVEKTNDVSRKAAEKREQGEKSPETGEVVVAQEEKF